MLKKGMALVAGKVAGGMMAVGLVATFVCTFFFLYVSEIEQQVVQTQMSRIVDQLFSPMVYGLNDDQLDAVLEGLDRTTLPDMTEQDAEVRANNDHLMRTVVPIFIGFTVLCFGAAGLMRLGFVFNYGHQALHNVLMLLVVMCVYFLFMTFVARDFYLIDTNYVRAVMLRTMRPVTK